MVLPLLKLGTLALKTLTKPVINKLKKEAGLHPRFRQLIINFAQANHRITTKMQRIIYSHATDVEISPLNEEKAVQDAVNLIGEVFLFSVACAVVIFEVQRSARSEARKEELRRKEMEALRRRDENLSGELELLRHKLEELEQLARGRGLAGSSDTLFVSKPSWNGSDVKPPVRIIVVSRARHGSDVKPPVGIIVVSRARRPCEF